MCSAQISIAREGRRWVPEESEMVSHSFASSMSTKKVLVGVWGQIAISGWGLQLFHLPTLLFPLSHASGALSPSPLEPTSSPLGPSPFPVQLPNRPVRARWSEIQTEP